MLYAIQGELTRCVKVGFTRKSDMSQRLRSLQAASPDKLHVIGVDPRDDMETVVHWAMKNHRLHGEWFSPEVGEYIALHPSFTSFVDVCEKQFNTRASKIKPRYRGLVRYRATPITTQDLRRRKRFTAKL